MLFYSSNGGMMGLGLAQVPMRYLIVVFVVFGVITTVIVVVVVDVVVPLTGS